MPLNITVDVNKINQTWCSVNMIKTNQKQLYDPFFT